MRKKGLFQTALIAFLLVGVCLFMVSVPVFAAPKPVAKEWKLGAVYPMTGVVSWAGELYKWFAEKAVKEINDNGGVRGVPIKLTIYDDGMDQTRAASRGAKAISDGSLMLLTGTSVTLQTVGPLGKRRSVPVFNPNLGLEDIQPGRPWAVSFGAETEVNQRFNMNAWLDQISGVKTAVVLYMPTIGQWVESAKVQSKILEEKGIKVVDKIEVMSPVVDASTVAIRILDKGADCVSMTVNPADAFRIIMELKERGFTKMDRIFINEAAATTELLSMAGEAGNTVDGIFTEGAWHNRSDPEYQRLLKDFQALKGRENESELWFVADHYMSVYFFKHVIEATGITGDPAKLAAERKIIFNYLNSIKDYDTVFWGRVTVLPSGVSKRVRVLFVIKDNKKVEVISSNAK